MAASSRTATPELFSIQGVQNPTVPAHDNTQPNQAGRSRPQTGWIGVIARQMSLKHAVIFRHGSLIDRIGSRGLRNAAPLIGLAGALRPLRLRLDVTGSVGVGLNGRSGRRHAVRRGCDRRSRIDQFQLNARNHRDRRARRSGRLDQKQGRRTAVKHGRHCNAQKKITRHWKRAARAVTHRRS